MPRDPYDYGSPGRGANGTLGEELDGVDIGHHHPSQGCSPFICLLRDLHTFIVFQQVGTQRQLPMEVDLADPVVVDPYADIAVTTDATSLTGLRPLM